MTVSPCSVRCAVYTCPQCKTELPAITRACPCCGKSFLTTQSAVIKSVVARAQEAAAKTDAKGKRAGKDHPDRFVNTLLMGAGLLLAAGMALYLWGQRAPKNPYLTADGRVMTPEAAAIADGRIRLVENSLATNKDKVQVGGLITNNAGEVLLTATIVTDLKDNSGKTIGTARGYVSRVNPGASVSFTTKGQLKRLLLAGQMLDSHTRLADIQWAGGRAQ